ncbi:MAG: hypothetical protein ACHQ0J_08350 [Candidatus Dormibacterales bacterium]
MPALVMALGQPVWSRIDEAQHADFIIQLSHGVYPAADMTVIDPETLKVMQSTGFFTGAQPGTYPVPDLTDLGTPPPGMTATANAAWMSRHLWQLSFESAQTPGYYLLMVPIWWLSDHAAGTFAAIYMLRVINALLIALLAPMAFAVARMIGPGRPGLAATSVVFAILLPGLDLNGTRISNDGLSAAIGGLFVLLLVRWTGASLTWRRVAALGLLLGAGLLVKLTLAGLFPALAAVALVPAPGAGWPRRLLRVAVAAGIAIACLLPWFLINLHLYGGLTPGARGARLSDAVPAGFQILFVPFDLAVFGLTFWSGEPFGALPLAALFSVVGALLALTAPIGVVRWLKTEAGSQHGRMLIAVTAGCGMAGVALILPAAGGFEFGAAGRYLYPALPAVAALIAIGLHTVLARPPARRLVTAFYSVSAAGIMAAYVAGIPALPSAGAGQPPVDVRIVPVAGTGSLDGVTIMVSRVALDGGSKTTWFQVRATNSSPGEIEWSVVPVASIGGQLAYGDYARSSQLPGDLDPGQSESGWLMVPFDPAQLAPGEQIYLRFTSVAVNGYATVKDVDLTVSIPAPLP